MRLSDNRFVLCGYVPNYNKEGFGIPVFRGTSSHSFFFQDVDKDNFDRIIGFTPVDGYNENAIILLKNESKSIEHFGRIKVNDYAIFVFETKEYVFFDIRAGLYNLFNALIESDI